MEFSDIQKRALKVRAKYSALEKHKGIREWSREDHVRGFVGDVGDLAKFTMAEDGLRTIDNSKEKIAHELADCLWSIIIISDEYDVDLRDSFLKTMDKLEEKIDSELSN